MPDTPTPDPLARATAGQFRRAGFAVEPADTDDSATVGFDVVCHHGDERSKAEITKARKRGDDMPKGKP